MANPVKYISTLGITSDHAYTAAFASIAFSYVAYLVSRARKTHDKAQSDRWGIFVGHWATTFMALGIALKLEEKK